MSQSKSLPTSAVFELLYKVAKNISTKKDNIPEDFEGLVGFLLEPLGSDSPLFKQISVCLSNWNLLSQTLSSGGLIFNFLLEQDRHLFYEYWLCPQIASFFYCLQESLPQTTHLYHIHSLLRKVSNRESLLSNIKKNLKKEVACYKNSSVNSLISGLETRSSETSITIKNIICEIQKKLKVDADEPVLKTMTLLYESGSILKKIDKILNPKESETSWLSKISNYLDYFEEQNLPKFVYDATFVEHEEISIEKSNLFLFQKLINRYVPQTVADQQDKDKLAIHYYAEAGTLLAPSQHYYFSGDGDYLHIFEMTKNGDHKTPTIKPRGEEETAKKSDRTDINHLYQCAIEALRGKNCGEAKEFFKKITHIKLDSQQNQETIDLQLDACNIAIALTILGNASVRPNQLDKFIEKLLELNPNNQSKIPSLDSSVFNAPQYKNCELPALDLEKEQRVLFDAIKRYNIICAELNEALTDKINYLNPLSKLEMSMSLFFSIYDELIDKGHSFERAVKKAIQKALPTSRKGGMFRYGSVFNFNVMISTRQKTLVCLQEAFKSTLEKFEKYIYKTKLGFIPEIVKGENVVYGSLSTIDGQSQAKYLSQYVEHFFVKFEKTSKTNVNLEYPDPIFLGRKPAAILIMLPQIQNIFFEDTAFYDPQDFFKELNPSLSRFWSDLEGEKKEYIVNEIDKETTQELKKRLNQVSIIGSDTSDPQPLFKQFIDWANDQLCSYSKDEDGVLEEIRNHLILLIINSSDFPREYSLA